MRPAESHGPRRTAGRQRRARGRGEAKRANIRLPRKRPGPADDLAKHDVKAQLGVAQSREKTMLALLCGGILIFVSSAFSPSARLLPPEPPTQTISRSRTASFQTKVDLSEFAGTCCLMLLLASTSRFALMHRLPPHVSP